MTVNDTEFTNWQDGRQPGPPYSFCSPNLTVLGNFLIRWFGFMDLGCFGIRPVRLGSAQSSHSFGSSRDLRWFVTGVAMTTMLRVWQRAVDGKRDRQARLAVKALGFLAHRLPTGDVAAARAILEFEVLPWLIDHSEELGIQAIHDYYGCRIWRSNRGDGLGAYWKTQTPGADGMGQSWAQWIHIETHAGAWFNATPISRRIDVAEFLPATPLRLGSKGKEVVKLRALLGAEGLPGGGRTGAVFTKRVRRGVKALQKRLGIHQTGVWNATTRDAYRNRLVTGR